MARLVERVFDPAQPLVVRRFFAYAGRHWNAGDLFPWTQLAVDMRRVRQLFEAGKLMHPNTEYAQPASASPIPARFKDEDAPHVTAALESDELDGMNMRELRAIAEAEGAAIRLRREDQRQAIRDGRRVRSAA